MASILGTTTAKWFAPTTFLLNLAAQIYGTMFSKPNMKDINDANMSFFSPQPVFIAAFFLPQQIIQLAWLYRLWRVDGEEERRKKNDGTGGGELDQMVDYVPYYSVGNLCIAAWMLAWNSSHLGIAHAFVTINTFTQLYYMAAKLPRMDRRSPSSILTHVVCKTFAGIGVLDFLHNGSIAFFKDQPATTAVKVLTGVAFGVASAASDWIFGACLVYDLVAFAVGQKGSDWGNLLGMYAFGAAAIVAVKNVVRPPYSASANVGYQPAPGNDGV